MAMSTIVCKECVRELDALVDGTVGEARAAELHEHLEACAGCARQMEELAATVELLRRAGVPELPDGYEQALHRKLAASPAPAEAGLFARLRGSFGRSRVAWAAVGAAAAAGVAFAVVGLRRPQAPPGEAIAAGPVAPTFRVPARKLAVVKIDFVAEQAVSDVEFASGGRELPDREFRWHAPLSQGSNAIPVAVRGAKRGVFRIEARALGNGVDAKQMVELEVTS
jgi:anti-sigma factor RsiW